MSILLKKVKVVDSQSSWNGKSIDLFISKDGKISKYDDQKVKKEVSIKGAFVFPGILDLSVNFCEPGLEQKETIMSGSEAAARGGVTAVLQVPNVEPVIDSKETITYAKSISNSDLVDFYVQAGVSKGLKCTDLTEALDMTDNGADAFGDGYKNIWHSGLLLKALQYLQHTDKVLITQPYDKNLNRHGLVHEGEVSTRNGIAGIPSLVEQMAIARDLEILKYAGGKLHFAQISSAESVSMIKQAKKEGLNVTCGVNYFNLIETEKAMLDFDSNNKIYPPLRTEKDRKVLLKGVKDGVIDVIVSNHQPQEEDCKKSEFNYTEFGKIGLQTMFIALKSKTDLSDEELQNVLVINPRTILGKPSVSISDDEEANFFICVKEKYTFDKKEILSLSCNTSEIDETYDFNIKGLIKGANNSFFGN